MTLVADVLNRGSGVYIHSAKWHGRTGLVAAALLLRHGDARDAGEAMAMVRDRRPKARLSGAQERALVSFATPGIRS